MTASCNSLLPLQVRAYPGDPMTVQRENVTWAFKPFKFFAANGDYIGEIIHSTSPRHGIADLAQAQALATRIAVATNCCDVLLDACKAIDADIELHGYASEQSIKLARYAVAMAHEVERLVQK